MTSGTESIELQRHSLLRVNFNRITIQEIKIYIHQNRPFVSNLVVCKSNKGWSMFF